MSVPRFAFHSRRYSHRWASHVRKFCIILYLLGCVALFVGVLWPYQSRLTDNDLQRIVTTVETFTSEPILSVRPGPRWSARIETGRIDGGLYGGGFSYFMRRGWDGWYVYKTTAWVL